LSNRQERGPRNRFHGTGIFDPQDTPGIKDWGLVQLVFYLFMDYRVFIQWEEERMSFETFGIVIIVDRNVHEMASVKAEGSTLFEFSENIGSHNFSRAM
jgi:hypothetical protein